MKRSIPLFIFAFLFFSGMAQTQSFDFMQFPIPLSKHCKIEAHVVVNSQICDDSYFIADRPKVSRGLQGMFSMTEAQASQGCRKPLKPIPFQIAIRNSKTNTMWITTSGPVLAVDIDEVLRQCEADDELIFLPTESSYMVRQHVMPVMVGC